MKKHVLLMILALLFFGGCESPSGGNSPSMSDEEAVSLDAEALSFETIKGTNSAASSVVSDLDPYSEGTNGSKIVWTSSLPDIVEEDGDVNRPPFASSDLNVTLTAALSKGSYNTTKNFSLTVLAEDPDDSEAVAAVLASLNFYVIAGNNTAPEAIRSKLVLMVAGEYDTSISWSSGDETLIDADGTIYPPLFGSPDANVTLSATVSKGWSSSSKEFPLTLLALEPTDTEAVDAMAAALDFSLIAGSNSAQDAVASDLGLISTGLYDTNISWSSSDISYVAMDGSVSRPSYMTGSKTVTLNATISRGEASARKDITMTVAALPVSADEQAVLDAYALISFDDIKNGNTLQNDITGDLTLPTTFGGTTISWSSTATARIGTTGSVSRPSYSDGSMEVNVTAAISSGTVMLSKGFQLRVTELAATDTEAVTEVYNALTFAKVGGDNHDADHIVFDLFMPASGANSVAIDWNTSNPSVIALDGNISRPVKGAASEAVELNATISRGGVTMAKSFGVTVLAQRSEVFLTYDSAKSHDVFMVEPMNGQEFNVTVDLGGNYKDVFFVLSNTNTVNTSTPPAIDPLSNISAVTASSKYVSSLSGTLLAAENKGAQRGTPEISRFNASRVSSSGSSKSFSAAIYGGLPEKSADTVGDVTGFYTESDSATAAPVAATCKKIVNAEGRTLNVWVADNVWDSCSKLHCIDQTMVDAVAERFLQDGYDNDIHGWISNIYGEEWENHAYSNLISDDNNITIFILDIEEDNSDNGGVAGFFWAKDNYLATSFSGSNERIMFYLDAVMLANGSDGVWEPTDYWPSEIFSTLAHEYQHMIHFYQKQIKAGASSSTDTWLNEMCSTMSEDFIANKLRANGPRGVAYDDGTSGGGSVNTGWMPRYNVYNYIALTDWLSGTSANEYNILNSYAITYAFGAYLARNYGGPELFRRIVQNDKTDATAISYAMEQMGYKESLATLLPKWGAANLLSDIATTDEKFRYNRDGFFSYLLEGNAYSIGSIDIFKYSEYPSIYYSDSFAANMYKNSNTLLYVGTGIGTVTRSVLLEPGVNLTVVVK